VLLHLFTKGITSLLWVLLALDAADEGIHKNEACTSLLQLAKMKAGQLWHVTHLHSTLHDIKWSIEASGQYTN